MSHTFNIRQWKDLGSVEYLLNIPEKQIGNKFKKSIERLTLERKHEIRQEILSRIGHNTASLEVKLQTRADGMIEYFKTAEEAVYLRTCKVYHPFHINHICKSISKKGDIVCSSCQTQCKNVVDIVIDAFLMSYFQKVKNFEGSMIIFQRKGIGSTLAKSLQQQAQVSQTKTLLKEQNGYELVQIKIYQFVKDTSIAFSMEQKRSQLESAINRGRQSQYESQFLEGSCSPILMNLICFSTNVRIRNPLIHKHCKPQQHSNRLVLYSFENVYSKINSNNKTKIKCIYPNCPNYFSGQNFIQNSIVLQNLRKTLYEEQQCNMFAFWINGLYQREWHSNYSLNALIKDEHRRKYVERYKKQIQKQISNMTSSLNLQNYSKKKISKKAKEDTEEQKKSQIKLDKVKEVAIGLFTLCPIRCTKCKKINTTDIYDMLFSIQQSEKKCPLCLEEIKQDIYLSFYIDLKLMQFIFLQGQASKILYDEEKKYYFHKLSYYSANSLKQRLLQQKKTYEGNIYNSDMSVRLDPSTSFIPFIDLRCKNDAANNSEDNINEHVIYLPSTHKISEKVQCPKCKRFTRSDQLLYNSELQRCLKKNKNQLIWRGRAQGNIQFQQSQNIASLRYYHQIPTERDLDQLGRVEKIFYWKNYQGNLIKYPIKFKSCQHSIETSICDFQDILYQSRVEGQKKFKCRFLNCNIEYENIEDIERISLDIYKKIESNPEQMKKVIIESRYWITYNFGEGNIVKTSQTFKDNSSIDEEENLVNEYRTVFNSNSYEQFKTIKEAQETLRDVTVNLKNDEAKIKQDEKSYLEQQKLIHSQNIEEFKKKQEELSKQRKRIKYIQDIIVKKQRKIQEEYRKTNSSLYLNFSRISSMFPKQMREMQETDKIKNNIDSSIVSFQGIRTHGNLYLFQHPIEPYKSDEAAISMSELNQRLRQL